ncbi:MAG: preprotein translocase subunit SecG [Trueperaceae bacterium]|nr:preprotein translocase subunit SecG [Trueperaceae bacterium]
MFILFWFVFILFILASITITTIILLQEPKQAGGLGGMDGGGGQDFSSVRGTAGGLHRMTVWLGVVWGLLALALAVIPRA